MHDHDNGPAPTPEQGYERRDIALGPIIKWGVGFGALTIVGFIATWLSMRAFQTIAGPTKSATVAPTVAQGFPQLQGLPKRDIDEFKAAETGRMEQYAWMNRDLGIVRIPVDRAIDLLVERGLPARAAEAAGREVRP